MSYLLDELNPQQQEAVRTTEGPILIVAGAGTGKTRTLSYRLAYLLAEKKVPASAVMAVTFTNKAAHEMKERIKRLVGTRLEALTVGTFHAISSRLLRQFISPLGWTSDFGIYGQREELSLLKRILSHYPQCKQSPASLRKKISEAKNQLIAPEQLDSAAGPYFPEIYQEYQTRLRENNALDLDDLILSLVRLWQERPQVLEECQDRFLYLMVDEYQDINLAQYQWVQQLSKKYRNLCVIGDADQAIYAFRGANIQNFLDFQKDYPEAKVVRLEQNYRSTKTILEVAGKVIQKTSQRLEKELWTENEEGARIWVCPVWDERAEAKGIVHEIEKMIGGSSFWSIDSRRINSGEERAYCFSDFAVLYRLNAQKDVIAEAFTSAGIPYQVVGGTRLVDQEEVADMLAYLKVINNPEDSVSLLQILNKPAWSIGLPEWVQTITALEGLAESEHISLYQAISQVLAEEPTLTEFRSQGNLSLSQRKAIRKFASLLEQLKAAGADLKAEALVRKVLTETNPEGKNTEESEPLLELLAMATPFNRYPPATSLKMFLEEIALVGETDTFDERANAVALMTLHAAKGLEFPVVFICGVEAGLIPYIKSVSSSEFRVPSLDGPDSQSLMPPSTEEERRLFYVGLTRAQKHLYLFHARQRYLYGQKQVQQPSPFLADIPGHLTQQLDIPSRKAKKAEPKEEQLTLW
ncbi:MAG: UvrD-helicase domain-containing protein [bacterium]